MKTPLFKTSLTLALILTAVGTVWAQSLTYKSAYDISSGMTLVTSYDVSGEQPSPQDVFFAPDGLTMFTVGPIEDEINQFSLSVAYDLTSVITHQGTLSTVGVATQPSEIAFSSDGMELFTIDSKTVEQYSLTSPYDITQPTTFTQAASTGSGTTSVAFSPDGLKMIVGRSVGNVAQYLLSTPFDLATRSFQGYSAIFSSAMNGLTFDPTGTKLFVASSGSDDIAQYTLSTPYDVLAGISASEATVELSDPLGLTFNPDGTQLFVARAGSIHQYDLNTPLFRESSTNDGSVSGTFTSFALTGETFTHAGSSLTFNTDYQISNLPAGLIPTIEVSATGETATLSFSGQATDHQDVDDVSGLIFTFSNSAFTGNNASSVANAVAGNSNINLDFRDNYDPILTIGDLGEALFGLDPTTVSVAAQDASPRGLAVNDDGTKLFMLGDANDAVFEYSLTTPYDITDGVTYTGNSYSVIAQENAVRGLTFSTDGTKMFVGGLTGDDVNQYSLSQPFDITSTVTHEGSHSVASQTVSMEGVTFAPHGYTMYVTGFYVFKYSLTAPFDITSGVTFVEQLTTSTIITDAMFTNNGRQMYVTGFGASIYELNAPYDISGGYTKIQSGGTIANYQVLNPDGSSVIGLNTSTDAFVQQNLLVAPFEETYLDDGSILGSKNIYISDDAFVNAGSTLTEGIHYSVTGIPSGLSPLIAVNQEGSMATFTLTGNATNNDVSDNFSGIEFTFTDAAFSLSTAADVTNSSNTPSFIEVEFRELQPLVYADQGFTTTGLTYSGNTANFAAENANLAGLKFSNDGLKMYIVDNVDDEINQYSLSSPYNFQSATHDGAFDASSLDTTPTAITFNQDGTKAYIAGSASDNVYQYSLTTPYDLLGSISQDGSNKLIHANGTTTGINPQALHFAPDGKRLFATGNLQDAVYQYALDVPYDITSFYVQAFYEIDQEGNNLPAIGFSPDGTKMMVLGASTDRIFNYTLTEPYNISTASYDATFFSTSSQEGGPFGFTFSSAGDKLYVVGNVNDAVFEYEYSNPGYTEVVANDGSVSGSFEFKVSGTEFANAGGTLPGSAYNASGMPSGLDPLISISGDGTTATLTFTGQADDHQDVDDASGFTVELLDAAFNGTAAAEVINSTLALVLLFDFNDNGNIIYNPVAFQESYQNLGEIEGSMLIQIANETFTNPGGTLTLGDDYSIANVPSGLVPNLAVTGSGLAVILTFSGTSDNHQNVNDLSDLVFTFENSAFTTSEAQYVFNSTSAASGGSIDFDDNQPFIRYGNSIDIGTGLTPQLVSTYSVASETTSPTGMTLSPDGLRIYVTAHGEGLIHQYSVSSPFDISSGVTLQGTADISADYTDPSDIVFNNDGTKLFVTGFSNRIYQYSVSVAYDLTSTIVNQGEYNVSSQGIQTAGVAFNDDGTKMFTISASSDVVNQYSLTTPFDITSGVSFDGSPYSVTNRNYTDIIFSPNGRKMFLSNSSFPGFSSMVEYELTVPFDITSGVSSANGFPFVQYENGLSDAFITDDNKKLFVLGSQNDLVYEFNLSIDGFKEVAINDGEVTGSLKMEIFDDQFTNAGGTLTYGSDYTIDNLPAGLTASLEVSADGFFATTTLSGKANDHQNVNDVEPQFTFNNSAFLGGDASNVTNAIGGAGSRLIDFRDNVPGVYYGDPLNPANTSYSGTTVDISAEDGSPYGIAFNNDGTRFYIVGDGSVAVFEYSLSEAYDLSSTVAYTGKSLDLNPFMSSGTDLRFSNDGSRLFIINETDDEIMQFNLSTPFDLTTATDSGLALDISFREPYAYGMTFDHSGTELYIVGNDDAVQQYKLSTPFDISTASFWGRGEIPEDGEAVEISSDGRYLIVVSNGVFMYRYFFNSPFDVRQGLTSDDYFDVSLQDTEAAGIAIKPDGSRIFISGADNGEIHEYTVEVGGFSESAANDGTVDGSINVYLVDDTFTNAGGTLSLGTHYNINNLPAGLAPVLNVSANGYSAILTLTGSALDHADADDLASLQFSFQDAAFTNYDVSEVDYATDYSTGLSIDYLPYTDNDIVTFTFSEINGSATINTTAHTVNVEAIAGTDISALSPSISVSTAATVSPNSGTEQDFSTMVTYTVTAEDGTPQDWDVTITEALAAPTDMELTSLGIDENNSLNDVIGVFSTTDASFDETFTYSYVDGPGDEDNGSFNIVGDELQANEVFDHETKSSYSILVETTDNNGGFYEEIFVISINDVNEAPTDMMLDNNSIDESNPVGTLIGTLSSVDEDAGQSHSYSLVSGIGDVDNASFTISDDELLSAEIFDFETKNSYSIRILTEDGNGGAYEKAFSISINDLPPSITALTLTSQDVDENESANTVVGNLVTTGEDLADDFNYELASGSGDIDNTLFAVDDDELQIASSFDFETKNTYSIRVKTSQGAQTLEKVFTISVNDVSEAPTDLELSVTSITENNNIDDLIGLLSTTDEDDGETHLYSLVSGTGDDHNDQFEIVEDELRAGIAFDFESQSSYSIRMQTDDQNGGIYSESFTITILDENETIVIVNALADQDLLEDFGTKTLEIEDVFEDQDGDDLEYDVSSSNEEVVLASLSENGLVLTEVGFGTATITLTADDGSGVTNSDEFDVTVTEVLSAETDIVAFTLLEQAADAVIDDTNHTIDIEVVFGTDLTDLEPTIEVSDLAQYAPEEVKDFEEPVTYTITAEDGTTQEWVITVTEAPNTATDILSFELEQQTGVALIDASNHTVSIEVNYGTDLTSLDPSISLSEGASISPTGVRDFSEEVIYTVTAEDGTTSEDWTITVIEESNNAPTVVNPLADQTSLTEGFEAFQVDYSEVFEDGDDDELTITVASSDQTVVTATVIANDQIQVDEIGIGTSTITLTADDGKGGTVSDEFLVTVSEAPNNAPTVENPLSDQNSLVEGFEAFQVNYAEVFEDADGDELTITVSSSDETVATATVIANDQIQVDEVGIGTSTITLIADDGNGGTVSDEFTVTINEAPNNAPTVENPLTDQTSLVEGFETFQVNYSDVFKDADGDELTITVSSSDEAVVTATVIANDQIQIDEVGVGTSTIRLTADDGNGGSVSDEFVVTVGEAPNSAPTVVNPLTDQTSLMEGFGAFQVNYSDVFEDADGDELTITVSSSDETVVTATVIANNQIQVDEVGIGTSTIILTADDGNGGAVSDEFTVTVSRTLNTATEILAFELPGQIDQALIDTDNHLVTVEVDPAIDLTNLAPTISISEGATIDPTGAQNFTDDVLYTVTAEDGSTTQAWTVSVTQGPLGLEAHLDVQIYPNPAIDEVHIRSDKDLKIALHTSQGVLIKTVAGQEVTLNLEMLPAGIYILRLETDSGIVQKRLIKQM